jgi:hypothetical protein
LGFVGFYGSFGLLGSVQSRTVAGLQTFFDLSDFILKSVQTKKTK